MRLRDRNHFLHRQDRLDAIQRDRPLARDARETDFARSVIAEAERRRRNDVAIAEVQAEKLTTICGDCEREWPTDTGNQICPECGNDGEIEGHVVRAEPYDIGASNQSISDYWQRVGGHPDAGEIDSEDVPCCAWCGEPLPVGVRDEYCSTSCAVQAEAD